MPGSFDNVSAPGSLAGAATLRQVAIIDLPGPPGKRFDYLTIDYHHNYLLSAHLGAGLLYVIDLKTNKTLYVSSLRMFFAPFAANASPGKDCSGTLPLRSMP